MASSTDDMDARPKKRTKFDYFQDITVLVGEGESVVRYVVHKDVICDRSPFFREKCNAEWEESEDKTVRLPKHYSDAFGVYVGWLYTGEIDISDSRSASAKQKHTTGMGEIERRDALLDLVNTDNLGRLLRDAKFVNAVVDKTMALLEGCDGLLLFPHMFKFAWNGLDDASQMIQLLVDYHATCMDIKYFASTVEYPPSFIFELAQKCVAERAMSLESRQPRNRAKCYYHEHESESDRCD